MAAAMPLPTHVEAAAILRAYSERSVPLPTQDAGRWYAAGGRYWVLVWMVCGYETEGDKMHAADSLWWGLPLDRVDAATFWAELTDLAAESDRWQLAQGQDVSSPVVDVPELLERTFPWAENFLRIRPIWRLPAKAGNKALQKFISDGYKKLQEWRKTRPPGWRPPLPPPVPSAPGAGWLVLLLVGAIALGGTRRTPTRRRR